MDRHDDERDPVDMPDSVEMFPRPSVSLRDKPKQSSLKSSLRRARLENAERTDVLVDLHDAEMTRLEILRDHLQPVFDEIPADCDIFDPGITPGEKPRLFIDMVAFVEMGRDRRSYRVVQDSRAGRTLLSESERIDVTVRAITDYIARRLIEREKAMTTIAPRISGETAPRAAASRSPVAREGSAAPRHRAPAMRNAARGFLFLVEIVGSAVVFGALAGGIIWAWQTYVVR